MFAQLQNAIADFLFPPFCVSCNKPGEWWCAECRSGVQAILGKICPRCLSVERCTMHNGQCAGDLPFASVSAFGYYHDPKLRPIITALKFNGTQAVLSDLEKFITSTPHRNNIAQILESGCIVPMPLSDKRLRERGFNQAELIARTIAIRYSPFATRSDKSEQRTANSQIRTDLLVRTGHREAQSSLEHDLSKREQNIRGSFQCRSLPPKEIVLIDDVVTTGATAAEAARVLLKAGAETVHLVCLSIGA